MDSTRCISVCVVGALGLAACTEPDAAPRFEAPDATLRTELIRHLWGTDTLPDGAPFVERDVSDGWLPSINNIERIDRLTFIAPYADERLNRAVAYHYHPASGGSRLLIYHDAHCQPYCASSETTVQFFIDRQFSVLYFAMPMYGPNLHDDWREKTGRHNALAQMDSEALPVFRVFFDQIARGVAYAERSYAYDDITMLGYSGGAWESTLYPAMDPRIDYSFAIAGSMPRFLESYDEYEQSAERGFYQIADYEQLYYLAALGENRRHVQMFNLDDPCCWAARGREDRIADYARALTDAMIERQDPGLYQVHVVREHNGHEISDEARRVIATHIGALPLIDGGWDGTVH